MLIHRIGLRAPRVARRVSVSVLPLLVLPALPAIAQVQLDPVVVTATRFPEPASNLPFGVSVLNADAIRASGVTTVNEAIMRLLGVPGRIDFYGGGDYSLDLRGFGTTSDSNQVVIVDGIRVSEGDSGGTRLAGIPIDSVERIEVIRGSGAVLYGEGATGGVIVITTKGGRGVARQNQADLYVAAGSFGLREERASATLAAGEFSLDASANHRETDNDRANFASRTTGASLAGQWAHDGLRLGARYAYDNLDTGLPGSLTAAQYAADPHQTSTPLDSASIRNNRGGVFGELKLGDWQIGLDAGWRDKALTSLNSGAAFDYDIDANTYALRARHSTTFGAYANSFIAGLDHDTWKRTEPGAFGSVASQHSLAIYAKDELTLPGGTLLSAGFRTERVKKDNSSVPDTIDEHPNAWEFGVVQPLGNGVSVFGRYGRSFRLANADEFDFTTPGVSLQTQTSHDTELGARWAYTGGRAELRLYRSALTHEIGFDPNAIGPFGPGANINFDPTVREGLELEVTQALAANANLRVNAATRRARFSAGPYDGKEVPLTPRQSVSVHADWSPAAGHRIDGGVNFVSSQNPDFDNACRMPSHTTADLRYAYQWQQAELSISASNLTDVKYYTQAFGCTGGVVSAIYPEAGRALTAALRLHF
jgi:iron complex outermembrane receptor protein